jgi:hypothetical protein
LKKLFALITVVLMVIANMWYSFLTIKGVIHPTFMTWVIFLIAVSLSFATYWSSQKHSLLDNICNTGDMVLVLAVTIVIIFFGKDIRFRINIFEGLCLSLTLVIFIFWKITKSPELSNILVQVIMVMAYFPTFYHLWLASETSESPIAWGFSSLYALTGFITGKLSKDKLAIIYSARSLIMMLIMLYLILRI